MAYKPLIILAGGSGFLGRLLYSSLSKDYEFLVLGRQLSQNLPCPYQSYPDSPGDLAPMLEGALALINLAGKSVDCRYTEANKSEILQSRVSTTEYLGKAMLMCSTPPEVWINLSSAAIYPESKTPQTENASTPGGNFSEDVCVAWEKALYDAHVPGVRKVALRCGLVLGRSGGVFPILKKLAAFGLAGKQGNGNQFMSILHELDFVEAIKHLIKNRCMGAYNLCIPQAVKNSDFNKILASIYPNTPQLTQALWMIKLGSLLLLTEAELVTKSRCVIPERLLNEGFTFRFENPELILNELKVCYFQSAEKSSASFNTGNFSLASKSS